MLLTGDAGRSDPTSRGSLHGRAQEGLLIGRRTTVTKKRIVVGAALGALNPGATPPPLAESNLSVRSK